MGDIRLTSLFKALVFNSIIFGTFSLGLMTSFAFSQTSVGNLIGYLTLTLFVCIVVTQSMNDSEVVGVDKGSSPYEPEKPKRRYRVIRTRGYERSRYARRKSR